MIGALGLALQMALASLPSVSPRATADSLRDVKRAHQAQSRFEHERRALLPWGFGSAGRCDVRVGRFCWWYDGDEPLDLPEEPPEIGRRRDALLASLDDVSLRHPGDAWITGMRVYYRLEHHQPVVADSIAHGCRAVEWWCDALRGYVAQHTGDFSSADASFRAALGNMPDSTRCAWQDITVLLPAHARDRYERLGCADRSAIETRYWALATPRLSLATNEWRSEFYARQVLAALLATAETAHRLSWGPDAQELLLRYGWPVAWSRAPNDALTIREPQVSGFEPSPSFHFGPDESLLDAGATARDTGWDLRRTSGESRYSQPEIRRVLPAAVQLARFRRGDSTLIVAAWAVAHDSLRRVSATFAALGMDGTRYAAPPDSVLAGHARLTLAGALMLAGVELHDTLTGTLARSRELYPVPADTAPRLLSDLLLYSPHDDQPVNLDEALARAIPGDSADGSQPLGLYWEVYVSGDSASRGETTVRIERIDHGVLQRVRQRLGLGEPDTPLQIRWQDARFPGDLVHAASLSVDLSTLPTGRYRITLGVSSPGSDDVIAAREVEVVGR